MPTFWRTRGVWRTSVGSASQGARCPSWICTKQRQTSTSTSTYNKPLKASFFLSFSWSLHLHMRRFLDLVIKFLYLVSREARSLALASPSLLVL